jgi:alpha-D-ribose 1-methylphosphonate 5-triphosphate synthase subunit PhnG
MPDPDDAPVPPTAARRRWLSILAKAPPERLEAICDAHLGTPSYVVLRKPEVGLVMVQGRTSGSGDPFCVGEMTITRAAIRLDDGTIGLGYVGGRAPSHAERVALLDALLQSPARAAELDVAIVTPLEREAEARRAAEAGRAAATRVEFFTVAREAGA